LRSDIFVDLNGTMSEFWDEIEGRDDKDPLNISGQSQRRICEISQFWGYLVNALTYHNVHGSRTFIVIGFEQAKIRSQLNGVKESIEVRFALTRR
jgi:hypothetical protein